MFDCTITFPEQLLASARTHDKVVRKALEAALRDHHARRMPDRFTRGARAKYGYMARKQKYVQQKARKQLRMGVPSHLLGLDHVFTGRSMDALLKVTPKILISGSASSGTLRGRLVMRLPQEGGTGASLDDADLARFEEMVATGRDTRGRRIAPAKLDWMKSKLEAARSSRGKVGVTPQKRVEELRKLLPEEARETTEFIGREYVEAIKRDFKRPRRIKVAAV